LRADDLDALEDLLKAGSMEDDAKSGICLQPPCWELDGPAEFWEFLEALREWIPEDATLYFESGSPDSEIEEFMAKHAIPEHVHVKRGTLLPKPRVFHVPAKGELLSQLAKIMEHHAEPELAVHFHVYRGHSLLLEWYDAFDVSRPMLLSPTFSEDQVKALADRFGTQYRMVLF
jgi:hypothetical protein